ncbi:MAG TPA: MFS transporter, partial [Roseiarcus sp.]|nr:MFS transporter [Roseiarcus sp.]
MTKTFAHSRNTSRTPRLRGGGSIAPVAMQIVLMFTLTTLPTPLYRDYMRAFHFSILTLTLIFATYSAGTLATLLFLGRLSDQIGRRRTSLPAIGLAAIAALIFLLASNIPSLFAARLLTGIAAGLSSGTATAWLRDLHDDSEQKTASIRTVAVNVFALGLGPLWAGLFAAFAPWPMRLSYLVYILLLIPLAVAIAATAETVKERRRPSQLSLKPRIGVPRPLWAAFAAPGVTSFVIFALVGFYSAIAPNLLSQTLGQSNHAIIGGVVFELFCVAALTVYATRAWSSRAAMLSGAGAMLPALACLVLAQALPSMPALLAGTAAGGISLGLGYRGSLEVANEIAPENQRAEL